jgi:CRISPR-associated Cas5-like protein
MDTITLRVEVSTGHYRVPGQVKSVARSFPLAPPSTMRGFIESLCALPHGSLDGETTQFAYGFINDPEGRGDLFRKDHIFSTSGVGKMKEAIRPVHRETMFGLTYRVAIRGALVPLIRKMLNGDTAAIARRWGVLYLGESDDTVQWLAEEAGEARWLVPGQQHILPTKAGRGYNVLRPTYGCFDMVDATAELPEEAWLALPKIAA